MENYTRRKKTPWEKATPWTEKLQHGIFYTTENHIRENTTLLKKTTTMTQKKYSTGKNNYATGKKIYHAKLHLERLQQRKVACTRQQQSCQPCCGRLPTSQATVPPFVLHSFR